MAKRDARHEKPDAQGIDLGVGILGSLSDFVETLGETSSTRTQEPRQAGVHPGGAGGAVREGPAVGSRFSRILSGLADMAEKLHGISDEAGGTVSRTGEFTYPSKEGGVKGVYGFTLRTGLRGDDDQVRVEPFGNIRKDKATGEATVQEITEPLVDVFEDERSTTLVAEMPGVGPEDIIVDVREDILTIQAERGQKKYRKELLLGHPTSKDTLNVVCNNGVVTIRCERAE